MRTTIKQDRTDHFVIVCDCGKTMKVTAVKTCKQADTKVTYLIVKCPNCQALEQKKIYWNGDCAAFCE